MSNVSAVILTFNSASTIANTLSSLQWCKDIVVVDSGSGDETESICRNAGVKWIPHSFEGFGKQKFFAVNQTVNTWVFVIDSDEVCTPQLADEIQERAGKEDISAYKVPRSMVFMNRLIRYGGEYRKPHLRLFDRTKAQYNFDEVHEDVVVKEGNVALLDEQMLHYSYTDLHHYIEKLNLYTSRGADKLKGKGKRLSPLWAAFRLPLDFLRLYIYRGLILDGFPGFCWAALSSFYSFVKYIKLEEIYRKK